MNAHFLQLDYYPNLVAVREEPVVLNLVDFNVAYPSIEHVFMWDMLARVGITKGGSMLPNGFTCVASRSWAIIVSLLMSASYNATTLISHCCAGR